MTLLGVCRKVNNKRGRCTMHESNMDLFGLQGHHDSLHCCDWVRMAIILAGRDHNSFESTHSDERIKLTSSGFRTGCTLQSQTPWLTNQKTALPGATKNTLLPVFDSSLLWHRPNPAPLLSEPPPRALIGSVFCTLKSCNLQVELSLLFIIIIGKSIQKSTKILRTKCSYLILILKFIRLVLTG